MIFILFMVSLIIFTVLMQMPPGQRVAVYVKGEQRINQAEIEKLIEKYGINDPPIQQYGRWLANIFKGDFGFSTTAQQPVTKAFKQYFPTTLELVLLSGPLIILFGIWMGSTAAVNKNKPIDHGVR